MDLSRFNSTSTDQDYNVMKDVLDHRECRDELNSPSPSKESGHPFQYSCLKNPWTEEPGGLQSTGSQNVEHDRA